MIVVEDLSLIFDQKRVISELSFTINKGEKVAVTGSSGSGKTSLLNLLAGFIPDFTGKVEIGGKELTEKHLKYIRSLFAWMPQNVSLNQEFVKDLFQVTFGFSSNKMLKPSKESIIEMFNRLNLEEGIYDKKFSEISIGQKQRVLLSNCLLMKKPILIVDEPTAALDADNKVVICDYLLNNIELTVVAATHDAYWISKSNKVINLKD